VVEQGNNSAREHALELTLHAFAPLLLQKSAAADGLSTISSRATGSDAPALTPSTRYIRLVPAAANFVRGMRAAVMVKTSLLQVTKLKWESGVR
jgi:hypothetical protein